MIDTLRYNARLVEAGFKKEQADESIKILAEIMESNLATKIDMVKLENKIDHTKSELLSKIDNINSELLSKIDNINSEIQNGHLKLENKIEKSEFRMTKILGSILIISMSVIGFLIKL